MNMKTKVLFSLIISLSVLAVYAVERKDDQSAKTPTDAQKDVEHDDKKTTKTPDENKQTQKPVTEETDDKTTIKPGNDTKCEGSNCTKLQEEKTLYAHIMDNKDMLMRTFYVLLAVTSIVLIYFGVKAWRMKRRRSKSRKYGLISTRGSDLEMEPLDANDDDDDTTVFDVNGRQR